MEEAATDNQPSGLQQRENQGINTMASLPHFFLLQSDDDASVAEPIGKPCRQPACRCYSYIPWSLLLQSRSKSITQCSPAETVVKYDSRK